MTTYYDLLEIPNTATPDEMKRAYYAAVKKYTPEHNPKEFEQIKSAYDALRDPQKRLYYDSKLELNECNLFRYELAGINWADGRTGKAIKRYEGLLEEAPNNILLMRQLAMAYEKRGFFNKAIAQYEKLLSINKLDMNTWDDYVNCLMNHSFYHKADDALREAVALNEEHGLGNVDVLISAILYFIRLDDEFTRTCFDRVHKLDLTKSMHKDPVKMLITIVLKTKSSDFIDDALRVGKHIKPGDYDYESIEELLTIQEFLVLERSDEFDDVFASLFTALIDSKSSPYDRMKQLCMEGYILFEQPNLMRKQIRKINERYPRLFALHKTFLQSFLNEKNEDKMRDANVSEFKAMLKKHPELKDVFQYDKDEDDEKPDEDGMLAPMMPIRAQPKIGRNAPCPCGSGKKYKKCCGK